MSRAGGRGWCSRLDFLNLAAGFAKILLAQTGHPQPLEHLASSLLRTPDLATNHISIFVQFLVDFTQRQATCTLLIIVIILPDPISVNPRSGDRSKSKLLQLSFGDEELPRDSLDVALDVLLAAGNLAQDLGAATWWRFRAGLSSEVANFLFGHKSSVVGFADVGDDLDGQFLRTGGDEFLLEAFIFGFPDLPVL